MHMWLQEMEFWHRHKQCRHTKERSGAPLYAPSPIFIPRHTIVAGIMVSRWLSLCLSIRPYVH